MSAVLQTREDWLAQRRTGIGGSDVAAILGLSPWATPLDVYLEKRGEAPETPDNPAMRWGRALEPVVLQAYSDDRDVAVLKPQGIIANGKHPWMLASLDGFTEEPRVVEAKTARSGSDWGEPGTDQVPDAYALQVRHYMAVTGFQEADIAVLIGGSDFRIYTLQRDLEIEAMIFERLAEFWARVQDGNPPDPVSYQDAVQRYGQSSNAGKVVTTDPNVLEAWTNLRTLREERDRIESLESDCKADLVKAIGDLGDTLVDASGRTLATWKLAKAPERFDTAAFQAAQPALYSAFKKPGTPSRRLLIKE